MRIQRCVIVLAWVLSVVLAATSARAQTSLWAPITEPVVKAGGDLGFRVEWLNGRTPYGQLVIRQNGQWIEARIGAPGDRQVLPPPPPPPPAPAPLR